MLDAKSELKRLRLHRHALRVQSPVQVAGTVSRREDDDTSGQVADRRLDAAATAVVEGRTTHAGGRELRWILIDGRFYVRDGLPGMPSTMPAESTIRAFIEALRKAPRGDFEALVQAELIDRISESWGARADAIELALETPGALELSQDYSRATLRYGKGGAITLERTEMGWRVLELH